MGKKKIDKRAGRAPRKPRGDKLLAALAAALEELHLVSHDPRRLRPGELCRLLNSTPLGTVTTQAKLYQIRLKAGFRVSADGKHVDLFRLAAWLAGERRGGRNESPAPSPQSPAPNPQSPDSYAAIKERARARGAAASLAGRDIGPLPRVAHPKLKKRATTDFRFFCEHYFPSTFTLAFSADHLRVIAKIEEAVLRGGLFAMAMPRGTGKTSLCECACLWAALFGHREFVALIGASKDAALEMIESIKSELQDNDLLAEDFPEVCYPIGRLEGIANRCAGQLHLGRRTTIGWTRQAIVLPTIAGSKASGAILRVAGITGRIRGMKFKRADGESVRPSLVIVDDPQTDESARSLSQRESRRRILAGAILGLAGPGKKIAGVMPCTVICADDVADEFLDRQKHPEWQGERTKMVYAFPADEKLWEQYAEIRAEGLRWGRGLAEATDFYRQRQSEMDAGAVVAWPERFEPDEISAVQHAMNLKLRDERAFFAEYQNEPLPEQAEIQDLSADGIAGKFNRLKRCEVPLGASGLTAFIDVQQALLFYLVVAWEPDFTGYVVDYGVYPKQKRNYFTLRDAHPTLAAVAPAAGLEGSIYAGLETLTGELLGREWKRDDGAVMRIERCLIDANWGQSTDVVYQFCRQSKYAAVLTPSHGRYVGASSIPFSDYKKKQADRLGHNWRIPSIRGKRAVRHVLYDTNYWKSFVYARLAVAMGDRGCLSLFGDKPALHRLLAEHLTAEYRVKTEARGRTVDEWKTRGPGLDNHWFDCLVGAAVAASMQGASLPGTEVRPAGRRRRVSFAQMQAAAKR